MSKSHFLFSIKLLFPILVALFTLNGCGSGGGDNKETQYHESSQNYSQQQDDTQTDPIQEDTEDPKTLSIKVSPHILKIAYLPKPGSEENIVYSIENTSTEGNITLLDTSTGRYSYLSADNTTTGKDRFRYKAMKDGTLLADKEVEIEIVPINVKINFTTLKNFSSNLPLVIIDTGDKTIPDEPKIKGSMSIIHPDSNGRSSLELKPQYSGYIEIEIRGSSSQRFPKKQYSVDTETPDEKDDDISLLGMPEEHKWILHAPYSDKSLMRNYLAYHKTREIDESKYYAVRSRYVELLTRINEQYRYDGIYILMEKIKRDKNRIDIKKLKDTYVSEPKISGGYLLQQDRIKDEDEYITGSDGQEYVIEYPKVKNLNAEQSAYIENHIWEFENALQSDDYNNSSSAQHYAKWIDEETFIVHLLSREFFRDLDNWQLSEYFYKERSAPISMGPVWDFNLGMGNCKIGYGGRTDGWSYTGTSGTGHWVERLMQDPQFKQKVVSAWQELRKGVWSDSNLTQFIESTKNRLSEAAARNFERWPVLGKKVLWERKACTRNGMPVYCDTFESAVNEHLKVWLLERAKWIDDQFK